MASQSSTIQPVKLSENSADRISELPESILHHVLSFLSTQEAARTSVLSKRWQHLWTWVPDLDLTPYKLRSEVMSFDQLIFRIFLSRRAWCIRKFKLISTVVQRSVEELDFRMFGLGVDLFELPPSIFHCKTLVVLNLNEVAVNLSSSAHFPNLKALRLGNVKYKDEETFRNLFSGCPVLDNLDLGLGGSAPDNGFHYEISSLTVRHVLLSGVLGYHPPSMVTVSAPALEYFIIHYDATPNDLVLKKYTRLHTAFNARCLYRSCENYWGTVKGIFGALCNVKSLELKFCKVPQSPSASSYAA